MNKPSRITFAGLDEFLTVKDLVEIKKFSVSAEIDVEFGILVSKNPRSNRYPSYEGIKLLTNSLVPDDEFGVILSVHFCGELARNINKGYLDSEWKSLIDGTHRVQINLAGEIDLNTILYKLGTIPIIQCRGEFPTNPGRAKWLYDISGGRGIEPESYPKAPSYYCGYAGGISESNVSEVIRKINNPGKYWIDMESNIRVDDKFDLDTCKRIYDKVLNA